MKKKNNKIDVYSNRELLIELFNITNEIFKVISDKGICYSSIKNRLNDLKDKL